MNVMAAGIFCLFFYPSILAYAFYKKRWLEWVFVISNLSFAAIITFGQYNNAYFVSELHYPFFMSAIYGFALAWFPFPLAYVAFRYLNDD